MLDPLKNRPRVGLLCGGGLVVMGLACSRSQIDPRLWPLEPALAVPTPAETTLDDLALALRPEPLTVWDHLQQPDQQLYVVLLRHAIAPGTGDPTDFRLDDCATQRNLSAADRQTAAVKRDIRAQPNRGVIVMVTHQVNITALTGVFPGSGQAVVTTLDEDGDLAQVGLLDAGG